MANARSTNLYPAFLQDAPCRISPAEEIGTNELRATGIFAAWLAQITGFSTEYPSYILPSMVQVKLMKWGKWVTREIGKRLFMASPPFRG